MQIARLTIKRLRTALTDLRYGAILKGNVASKYSHLGATGTENSDYIVLEELFLNQIRPADILVDVGCGKGRVLNWWLDQYPDNQIYGIELDPLIAEATRLRLRRFKNVTILNGDACSLIPHEGSLFYLFNPFDGTVMQRFIAAILRNPRAANGVLRRIIYHNCVHLGLFENDPQAFFIKQIETRSSLGSALIDCTDIGRQNSS